MDIFLLVKQVKRFAKLFHLGFKGLWRWIPIYVVNGGKNNSKLSSGTWQNIFCFHNPTMDFRNILRPNNANKSYFTHIEGYFLGSLYARLNAFMQKLLDILIQIFRSMQNFLQSWIDKINTFSMSEQSIYS